MPSYDCIVYGQTEVALIAALNARARGLSVAILAGHDAFGGMFCNGLVGADGIAGLRGVAMQYFRNCGAKYGLSATVCGAPSANRTVFEEMLTAAGLNVTEGDVASVTLSAGRITRVSTTLGVDLDLPTYGVCIDGSYGLDLLVAAGCKTRVGREAQSRAEPLAGFGVLNKLHNQSPYTSAGALMAGIRPFPMGRRIGSADLAIQGMNYRAPIQTIASGGSPFSAPPNYDPSHYEWFNKRLKQTGTFVPPTTQTYQDLGNSPALPAIYDTNFDDIPFTGLDKLAWVNGSPATRAALATAAANWLRGYFYFFATDVSVWSERRSWFASMGWPPGEFVDNGNFPRQIYVRSGRRIEALYTMTQADLQVTTAKDDPVAFGRNSLDVHVCDLYANAPGSRATGVMYEGTMGSIANEAKTISGYHIPWRCLVPAEGARNIISGGFGVGNTHVAASSMRMTGTMLEMANAAGIGAWIYAAGSKKLAAIGEHVAGEVAAQK